MLHVCMVAFIIITCVRDNNITTMSSVAVVGLLFESMFSFMRSRLHLRDSRWRHLWAVFSLG